MAQKEELSKIVGSKNILDDPDSLEQYSKDMSFIEPRKPSYITKPRSSNQVQKLVKLASEELIPLTPVSSPGGPRFHGDTIPDPGGVVVDLSSIDRILRVDRRNKTVHIEPGVTFEQLCSELRKSGLKPFMPLMPRQTKSVLTSYLERDPILSPRHHWDTLDPIYTVEVIYGTGDAFRTGSAAGPGNTEELITAGASLSAPMGPGPTDYVRLIQGAQGTMGIVTWAVCACCLLPTIQRPYFVTSAEMESLIEYMYALLRRRLGDELFLINNFVLANAVADKPEDIKSIATDLPPWIVFLNIAGYEKFPEERVAYQEEDATEFAKQHKCKLMHSVNGVSSFELLKKLEEPSKDIYWKLRFKGSCEALFFLTTLNKVPEFIDYVYKTAVSYGYATTELGVYVQPIVQGTSCHLEFDLMYNPEDVREREKVKKLYLHLSEGLAKLGAFYTRPYGAWSDIAYGRDAQTTMLLRKIKKIFDPHDILNPGKLCF
jgi:FAD/FMN-containing dehydrogenase